MWNRICSISVTVTYNIILKRWEISNKLIIIKWKISVLMILHVMSVLKCVQLKLIWNTVRTPRWWSRKFSFSKKRMKFWRWTRRFTCGCLPASVFWGSLYLSTHTTRDSVSCCKWEVRIWLPLCVWRISVTGFLPISFLTFWTVRWVTTPTSKSEICVGW